VGARGIGTGPIFGAVFACATGTPAGGVAVRAGGGGGVIATCDAVREGVGTGGGPPGRVVGPELGVGTTSCAAEPDRAGTGGTAVAARGDGTTGIAVLLERVGGALLVGTVPCCGWSWRAESRGASTGIRALIFLCCEYCPGRSGALACGGSSTDGGAGA
jgi:hypothetical protein